MVWCFGEMFITKIFFCSLGFILLHLQLNRSVKQSDLCSICTLLTNTQESFIYNSVETITFQTYSVHHNNPWYSKWMHISRKQMDFRVQNKTDFFCIIHTHTHTHTNTHTINALFMPFIYHSCQLIKGYSDGIRLIWRVTLS